MYGSKMNYNFNTRYMSVWNARLQAANFVVLGAKIERTGAGILEAEDAEYTTCQDCPESWSVFGGKVHITVGKYVRITHAFIKINGVVAMYLPYIVFPIKSGRETGLLFPTIGLRYKDGGVLFKQPFFWNINDQTDMTFIPSANGKRGLGNEFQWRKVYAPKIWNEMNSIQLFDHIWEANRSFSSVKDNSTFRMSGDYEHHFSVSHNFNHHLYYLGLGDKDQVRDYSDFLENRLSGPYSELGGFMDWRNSRLNISLESYFNNNLLYENAKGFDHSFIQVLPKIKAHFTPISLWDSRYPFLKNIYIVAEGDVTEFRQDHNQADPVLREAQRFNLRPNLVWNFGNLGPVLAKTTSKFDYQAYRFSKENEKSFIKQGMVQESEVSIEIEKIFGVAFKRTYPLSRIEIEKSQSKEKSAEKKIKELETIGKAPEFSEHFTKKSLSVARNSYRHSQIFKLKHYFLTNQHTRGNDRFLEQLNGGIVFDGHDILKGNERLSTSTILHTSLPLKNTIELQWNNSFIRKTPTKYRPFKNFLGPTDNFSFEQVVSFSLSQGVELFDRFSENGLRQERNIGERLTRTHLQTMLTLGALNLEVSEYYFQAQGKHSTTARLKWWTSTASAEMNTTYDSFGTEPNKTLGFKFMLAPIDILEFGTTLDYSFEKSKFTRAENYAVYAPRNNCWKLRINYLKTETEIRQSFNLFFNFDGERFSALGQG